jgi:hypothetical protein
MNSGLAAGAGGASALGVPAPPSTIAAGALSAEVESSPPHATVPSRQRAASKERDGRTEWAR